MLSVITQDEIGIVKSILEHIRCLKLLKIRGYEIKDFQIYMEYYDALVKFGVTILDILTKNKDIYTEYVEFENEHESVKEYFGDEDYDLCLLHICIINEDIRKCREILYRTQGTDKDLIAKLQSMIDVEDSLITVEDYYDLLIPTSLENNPIFVISNDIFINVNFVLGYLRVLDYCKEVIENDRHN